VVRTIGKRGMGQLAPFDFVIIIALGSAVGDPMFYPNVPLLHALVAITAIVLLTRGVTHLTQRSRRIQDLLSATAARLVRDGVMDLAAMRQEGIARTELFEALRTIGIEHLGEVERAYLEPSGKISAFKQPQGSVRPDLPVLPEGSRGGCEPTAAGRRFWSVAPMPAGTAVIRSIWAQASLSWSVRFAMRSSGREPSPACTRHWVRSFAQSRTALP
jgi:hypothetical protein